MKILIVEDSKAYSMIETKAIQSTFHADCVIASSLRETQEILEKVTDFLAAILDLHLPDAENGEVVDYVLGKGIPSIILTGDVNDEMRDSILTKGIVDYVLKSESNELAYIISLLHRIQKNKKMYVLVIDDSRLQRLMIKKLLNANLFMVVEAESGKEALKELDKNPDIKLVVVDYNMPGMNGDDLVKEIRKKYPSDSLSIIGISNYGHSHLSAKFLKSGANDFINRPFLAEEFNCRVKQNVEALESIEFYKKASYHDFLTGTYNRKYLFETGRKLYSSAKRGQVSIALAILDIDFFKKVNDTFGHQAGDEVLRKTGKLLNDFFREGDIVVRFGGEEFCILLTNVTEQQAAEILERLRDTIEKADISFGKKSIPFTMSIGYSTQLGESYDDMVKRADSALYNAKERGRNRVERL